MEVIFSIFPALLRGLRLTILVFGVVLVISLPLGLFLSIIHHYANQIIKRTIEVYVYIMRSTPLLLQLMFFFYGLPYVGIMLGRFESAVLAMSLNYAAYCTEIFRGGIQSVGKDQFEAIRVLSIGRMYGFIHIIIPQVLRTVFPSIGNEVINLIKDTSLVYVLGLDEVLKIGRSMANAHASMVPFILVGVLFLILSAVLTLLLRWLERRIDYT